MLKRMKKIILGLFLMVLFIPVVFIGYCTLMNPVHEPIETITIENEQNLIPDSGNTFTVTTFNIGYAGLDEGQDFFADGGIRSRAESQEKVMENLDQSIAFLNEIQSDFYLIQEIDREASRSYDVEQYTLLKTALLDYASSFSYNYNAIWVPIPLTNPMGYANAGIGTFSKWKKTSSQRFEFDGQESWPKRLGELDRCMMQTDILLSNGKTLSLVNIHLSAYDKGGQLREKQVGQLKRLMNQLFEAGNYVVVGGDWNQLLIQDENYSVGKTLPEWLVKAPHDLTDNGFKWGVDEMTSTVRDLATAYVKGETFETVIDGFLVSPNIQIESVKGHNLEFKNSDHNPVTLTFKIIE